MKKTTIYGISTHGRKYWKDDSMITYNSDSKIFHLSTKNTSYVCGIYDTDVLLHLYWGAKIPEENDWDLYFLTRYRSVLGIDIPHASSGVLRMEYPTYGSADLRTPALSVTFSDGSSASKLHYISHKITSGKPALQGLPATYTEQGDKVDTLEIELADTVKDLHVFLSYSVFEDYDIITRSVRLENRGEKCTVNSVMSASIDLPEGAKFDMIHLDGAWARERHVARHPLFCGKQSVDSKRGASSHFHNPFVAFPKRNTDEDSGEVYAMNLVYSGNFEAGADMDSYDTARLFAGINPFGFSYVLENGEQLQAPEAVLVYSNEGLGGMSRIFHKVYRERLARGKFRDIERYALINNWEATYFKFTEEKLLEIGRKAKEIGLDLLVLDDGWFGKRNTDNCSLGDWYPNKEKLPDGLSGLADKLNAIGLKFGLWFEPEMVSPDSDLYRAHPDWALHINGREMTKGRNQYILDLSRNDVCDYIIESISNVLSSANIEYVKWDMNRNMTEIGSDKLPPERQCEVVHRYILGLYRILDTITSRFPDVLFEGCSGGGGRFDPGILYYMPQTWCSDDSDAVERLYIQYGTSMCYPYSSMGAHVSACPNHQVGRTTPFKMRGDVATAGQFGYEMDLSKLTDEETELAKQQIKRYKELGPVFHRGDCYRLSSPFECNEVAINFVSEDKNTVILCKYNIKGYASHKILYTKLRGLCSEAKYKNRTTGKVYSGAALMNIGFEWLLYNEYESEIVVFDRISD